MLSVFIRGEVFAFPMTAMTRDDGDHGDYLARRPQ
jgi:hypothetical protein